MRKRFFAVALCTALCMAVCACNKTTPADSSKPTTQPEDTTPQATVTGAASDAESEEITFTNYEDYVATTMLPKNYVGIEVEAVEDAEVEAYIQKVLENNRKTQLKSGAIENGDVATIDFTGYLDGEEFEGGSDIGYQLEIGSGTFIPGFEEGLIGAKKGETRSLRLKFPEDYKNNKDLAGKEVVFEVSVNTVAEYVLPELTDAFVADLTADEYTSVETFREYTRGLLLEEKKYLAVMDYLVENTVFAMLNEDYIQNMLSSMKEYYRYYASMLGYSDVNEFMSDYGVEDADAFWKELEEQIRREEQERVVLYCVAKAEKMTMTEEEFIASATELAESYGETLEEFLAEQGEDAVRQTMLMESALNFLLDSVVEKGEK
ncbi:MAG: trigger factor [Lachnospiraceae bacterium]|nr:trigger factor [Lachnospiraceae bacterium]